MEDTKKVKKTGAKSSATSTKKSTTKSAQKSTNAKKGTPSKAKSTTTKSAPKTTKKVVAKAETKKVPVNETTKKKNQIEVTEEFTKKVDVEEVKKEVKPLEIAEPKKEVAITKRTWIITFISVILLLLCVVAIKLSTGAKIEEKDYYVYSKDNNLILWRQSNNEKVSLTTNFVANQSTNVEYSTNTLYKIVKNKVYFIENVGLDTYNISYIELEKAFTNPESKVTVVEGATDHFITDEGTIVYTKDEKIIYNNLSSDKVIIEDGNGYIASKSGKYVYYLTKDDDLYSYDTKTNKSKLITEELEGEYFVLGDDVSYLTTDKYGLYTLYNANGKVTENITNYSQSDDSLVYYRIDAEKLKKLEPKMEEAEKSAITLEDFETLMKKSDTVLFYLGKPGCSYCEKLDSVFKTINATTPFSYVFVNTAVVENEVLTKILEKANISTSEFGTPTLIVTKNNKIVAKNVGYMEEEEATKFLKNNGVLSSKFTYENPDRATYTNDMLFLVSDTYYYKNGKVKKLTTGLLYAGELEKLLENDYQLSFALDSDYDYVNSTSNDLYYQLKLMVTRTKSGREVKTDVVYTDLKFLNYDKYTNSIFYQTDGDIIRNTVSIGGLKEKESYESICNMTSGVNGTYIIANCDDEYVGDSYKITSTGSKKIISGVFQTYAVGSISYNLKSVDSKYNVFTSDNTEVGKDLYYPISFDDDLFYVTKNTVTEATDSTAATYSYDLYLAGEKESTKLAENIDINLGLIALD